MRSIVLAMPILWLVIACAPRARTGGAVPSSAMIEATAWGTWAGDSHESEPGVISGTVLAANDGAAIPGAWIRVTDVYGHTLAETKSDASGAFRVDAPSRARIVVASAPGWAFYVEQIETVWTETPRIVMDVAVTVSGVVLAPDGAPIDGAEVWAADLQRSGHWPAAVSRIVRTDSAGRFTIRDAPDGLIAVKARHPSFAEGRSLIQEATGGRAIELDVGLERRVPLRARVAPNAEVGFLPIREINSNHAEASAVGRADARGNVELRVPPVYGWVVATAGSFDGATFVEIEEGARSASATVELEPYPRCKGRVLDADGSPLAGARVAPMYSWDARETPAPLLAMSAFRRVRQRALEGAWTDSNGRFDFPLFDPLEDGEITVWVERADGEDARSTTFRFDANPDITLEIRRAVRGTIRDANGHTLRVNGVVTAGRKTANGSTMRSTRIEGGVFELDGLDAGTWSLQAEVDGRERGPMAHVEIGEAATPPVTLVAGAVSKHMRVVRGRVHTKGGAPLAGVRISGGKRLYWEKAVRSGADGSFELSVPSSEEAIFFYLPEHRSAMLPIDGDAALDVTLVPGIASTE